MGVRRKFASRRSQKICIDHSRGVIQQKLWEFSRESADKASGASESSNSLQGL